MTDDDLRDAIRTAVAEQAAEEQPEEKPAKKAEKAKRMKAVNKLIKELKIINKNKKGQLPFFYFSNITCPSLIVI